MSRTKTCGERSRTIKVKEIADPKTNVEINDGDSKISQIKAEIAGYAKVPVLAEVETSDIWDEG
jgi:hypothetical protein